MVLIYQIRPIEPAVNPTAKKNANSVKSLGIEFTKKLREKGTKYELQVWDDLWHAWHFFPIKESSDALKKIVNFITSDSYSSPK